MKISFNKFKQFILESILDEDKTALIKKLVLPDIEDNDEKEKARNEMIDFFKRFSYLERELPWDKNHPEKITYKDFERVKAKAGQSKGAHKREIEFDSKAIFKSIGDRKFKIVGENDNWLFVAPLTYEAAKYCDSSENQGAGAKWCIGYEKTDNYWKGYMNEGSLFIMAFNKNYKSLNSNELQTKLKFMIEKANDGSINVWNQEDNKSGFYNRRFNITYSKLNSLFDIVENEFKKIKEEKERLIKQSLDEKIKNLVNVKEITKAYFTPDERQLITEIYIPGNIENIDNESFVWCQKLTSVTIGDGVLRIGGWAFNGCPKLKRVNIPDSVKQLANHAFEYCYSLENIAIPDSIEKIEKGTFWSCKDLTNIDLGNNIKSIDSFAFAGCRELKKVIIPKTVKYIGYNAFEDCSDLTDVVINSDEIEIQRDSFNGCSNLKRVLFKGKTLEQVKSIHAYPWGIENPEEIIKAEND